MTNLTPVPIGAVLVIELRNCRNCGATYTVPAHKLAQLYCAPHNPAQHAIEPSTNIRGSKRTIYYHTTECEYCGKCFKTNLDWDMVSELKIVVPHLPADLPPYEDYALACSVRDKLKNDLADSFKAYEKARKRFNDLTAAYNQAKSHAKQMARAHQPQTVSYKYSTKITPMRDIFAKPKAEAKVIIPATDDEI